MPGTLDREVELLKRIINYAVRCKKLQHNPIASVPLLHVNNTRSSTLTSEKFDKLYAAAEAELRPILLTAFDTGMRKEEILNLRRQQVDLTNGIILLSAQDTKTGEPRIIVLTKQLKKMLDDLPRLISGYVFVNPKNGTRWKDIRKMFARACAEAGLTGLWFHDLRRSFVTNARKSGVSESVVMRMSGHKSRNVFDRYNIVDIDDIKDAIEAIEKGMRKNG